ncbi:hypothetical protein C3L33_19639, partial [Rhododendron williamsianum]
MELAGHGLVVFVVSRIRFSAELLPDVVIPPRVNPTAFLYAYCTNQLPICLGKDHSRASNVAHSYWSEVDKQHIDESMGRLSTDFTGPSVQIGTNPSNSEAPLNHDLALPALGDLDLGVVASLPPDLFSEINDIYDGKLINLISKKKGKSVAQERVQVPLKEGSGTFYHHPACVNENRVVDKQYIKLRVETDIEEIYVSFRLLKSRKKMALKVIDSWASLTFHDALTCSLMSRLNEIKVLANGDMIHLSTRPTQVEVEMDSLGVVNLVKENPDPQRNLIEECKSMPK